MAAHVEPIAAALGKRTRYAHVTVSACACHSPSAIARAVLAGAAAWPGLTRAVLVLPVLTGCDAGTLHALGWTHAVTVGPVESDTDKLVCADGTPLALAHGDLLLVLGVWEATRASVLMHALSAHMNMPRHERPRVRIVWRGGGPVCAAFDARSMRACCEITPYGTPRLGVAIATPSVTIALAMHDWAVAHADGAQLPAVARMAEAHAHDRTCMTCIVHARNVPRGTSSARLLRAPRALAYNAL